jgi:hypothetical protein
LLNEIRQVFTMFPLKFVSRPPSTDPTNHVDDVTRWATSSIGMVWPGETGGISSTATNSAQARSSLVQVGRELVVTRIDTVRGTAEHESESAA